MSSSSQPGAAIVTGASSGIGKVYAQRLANRGHDVILVARREERLRRLAAELADRHGVRAEVVVADLSKLDDVRTLCDRIQSDSAVSMLVNNAGFSALRPLTQTPEQTIADMIALNVTALTLLSKAAVAAFTSRGRGALINIGSGAGFAPYPGIPVYGATKAYVYLFTQSIQSEVEGTQVRVQLVLPGAVVSEGWEVAGGAELEPLPPEIVMTTQDLVDAALCGLDLGERVTAPSVHDEALLAGFATAGRRALQGAFDATPAARYVNQ